MSLKKRSLPFPTAAADNGGPPADLALRERAYQALLNKLAAGELPPHSIVSEQSLAAELGMSRTPVREAIRRLVHEGLMEQLPRYGTRVREVSRRDLVELYELREALEPYAAAKVAGNLAPEELARLEGLVNEVRRVADELKHSGGNALSGPLLNRFLSADLGFHLLLLQAADNARLLDIVSQTRLLARIFAARRQAHDTIVLDETHRYHRVVLDAIKRGHGEQAAAAMRDHIGASKRRALDHFDSRAAVLATGTPRGMSPDLVAEFQRIEAERGTAPKKPATPRRAHKSTNKPAGKAKSRSR
ncbi:MAG: GntR family transcriptional regulator [Planctomycetes bacterium]|nr:GntR family transcriptional regulator [Planctomycetota bacterium]